MRQQIKRLENCVSWGKNFLPMKSSLVSIVVAVFLVGCGEAQQSSTPKAQPAEPVAEVSAQQSTPTEVQLAEPVSEVPAQMPPPPAKAQTFESVTEAAKPAQDAKSENTQANRALMDAVKDGNIEAIKQQLAAGANVNAIDDEGLTPLDRFGDEETATLLYKHGAKRARDLKAGN